MSRLVSVDDRLWLSRSWTTRERRAGEGEDSYVFVDQAAFDRRVAEGGFLEHAEFLGNLYGTPLPDPPEGRDLVLEIDVQGAAQVVRRFPAALMIFIAAPSRNEQESRLRHRGDSEPIIRARLAQAEVETLRSRELGAVVVINDDLERATGEVLALIDKARSRARG